ncbi:MAG: hypothetical protein ACRDD1_00320, partial [Planctomycetia bacterium]
MKCPACSFHTMPGATACPRCGSALSLKLTAAEVAPPRAGDRRRPSGFGIFGRKWRYRLNFVNNR